MIKTVLDHQLNIQHVFDILRPPHPKLKKIMRGKWRDHGVMVGKKRREKVNWNHVNLCFNYLGCKHDS